MQPDDRRRGWMDGWMDDGLTAAGASIHVIRGMYKLATVHGYRLHHLCHQLPLVMMEL